MFLITAYFRKSQSNHSIEKKGVVFYRITGQADDEGKRSYRDATSDIHGSDSSVLVTERTTILSHLRMLYCAIESLEDSEQPYTIDDVIDNFRKALAGDESMGYIIAKSRTDFPLRSDFVTLGREFKGDFNFVFPTQTDFGFGNVYRYIFNLSQSLKNEDRISHAKNVRSVLANLKLFGEGKDIFFYEIDKNFIKRYAEWLKQIDISEPTQSFYLRNFRMILNRAHADGLIGSISGWFQDVNTSVVSPAKKTDEKLNRELLLKIESLDLSDNKNDALVRDMFMFGFYCGGMELIDMVYLGYSNVHDGLLIYNRRLKGLERKIVLGKEAKKIIKRYEGKSEKYIFPLLALSGNVEFGTIRSYVCRSLKVIGKAVNYPKLSFNMNIRAYNFMLSNISIPELLLTGTSTTINEV